MSTLVTNCPRCSAKKITFDVYRDILTIDLPVTAVYEMFCICRNCHMSTVFELQTKSSSDIRYAAQQGGWANIKESINRYVNILGYISQKHFAAHHPPDYLPTTINNAFNEGATCLAVGCYNAACGEFRRCLDLATKDKLRELSAEKKSEVAEFLQKNKKPSLHNKLNFLFEKGFYPERLRTAADCVKKDGNDGLHDGGLGKVDAEDSLDSIYRVLEHLYTIPAKDVAATKRIAERHAKNNPTK